MRPNPTLSAFLLATALCAPDAAASGLFFDTLIKAGLEVDTNARRLNGASTEPELLERFFLELGLGSSEDDHVIRGSLRVGAKHFHETGDEDAVVTDLSASLQRRLVGDFGALLQLSARDRTEHGHLRDYARIGAQVGLYVRPGSFDLRAGPLVGYFLYKPDSELSSGYLGAFVNAAWAISDVFTWSLSYTYQSRNYSQRRIEESSAGLVYNQDEAREDNSHTVGTSLRVQTAFLVRLDAYWQRNLSNSFGKPFSRIVARLSATVSLPWELYLNAQASIQRTTFDEGVLIDPTFTVDDENRNSFELGVSRSLLDWLGAEVRYSLYLQEFGGDEVDYERHLLYGGLIFSP